MWRAPTDEMLARMLVQANFNNEPPNPNPANSGGGGGNLERQQYLENRVKELEGATSKALAEKVAALEADLREERSGRKTDAERIKRVEALEADAAEWAKLGKRDEVLKRLEAGETSAKSLLEYQRRDTTAKAAGLIRLEFDLGNGKKEARAVNTQNLIELATLKGLEFELGKTSVLENGQTKEVEAAFIKASDGKPVDAAQYLRDNAPSFLSWLADAPQQPTNGTAIAPQAGAAATTKRTSPQSAQERAQEIKRNDPSLI